MQECLSKDDGGTTFALPLHLHALFVALTFLRDVLSLADEYVGERNRVLEATTKRHVIRFRPKGDSAVCTAWLSGFAFPDALERDDLAAFCGWRRPIIGDLRLLGGDDGLEVAALRAAVDADVGVERGPDLERHLVATRADTPLLVAAAEVRG